MNSSFFFFASNTNELSPLYEGWDLGLFVRFCMHKHELELRLQIVNLILYTYIEGTAVLEHYWSQCSDAVGVYFFGMFGCTRYSPHSGDLFISVDILHCNGRWYNRLHLHVGLHNSELLLSYYGTCCFLTLIMHNVSSSPLQCLLTLIMHNISPSPLQCLLTISTWYQRMGHHSVGLSRTMWWQGS